MIRLNITQTIKLKTYIMRKRQQEEQTEKEFKEFEEKRLRHEKKREENLTELNKLKEQVSILEKELSEYRKIKIQLVKELDVVNKQLIEVEEIKVVNYNRNTQEIKEKTAEDKKCLNYHEATSRTTVICPPVSISIFSKNAAEKTPTDNKLSLKRKYHTNHKAALETDYLIPSPLYADVFESKPAKTTATDSILPAIPSNRNHKAALQNFYPSSLHTDVLKSNPAKTTATKSVLLSNKKYFTDQKATLKNEDLYPSPLYADVFKSEPAKTIATETILSAILSNKNYKATLQNFYPSPYSGVSESESQSSAPVTLPLSTVNHKSLPKNEEVRKHDDHKDEFDGKQTNLHVPTHSLVPLKNMSGDSDHKPALKKPRKKRKSKSQKQAPLKIPNVTVTNVHSLKENIIINKQNICDAKSIETQQLPQDVRRSGITSHPYPWPNSQLPLNRYPFAPMYPGVNANLQNCPMFCTDPNCHVRLNFMPPLTCANQIPLSFPPVCVSTFHTIPYLPPIYTTAHTHPSFSCTSVSTFHAESPFLPSTYAGTSHMIPALSLPPYASTSLINPDPSIVTSHAKPSNPINLSRKRHSAVNPPVTCANTSYTPSNTSSSSLLPHASTSLTNPDPSIVTSHAKPSDPINPSRKRHSAVNPPVTCANTSYTPSNTPSSSHPFINVNTSRANQANLLPGSNISLVNPPLSSIIYSTSRVISAPAVVQSNTSYAKPSRSINPSHRKQPYPYFTPITSPLPVTNISRVNSPMLPITCSTTSCVNPSCVTQNISIPSYTDSSSFSPNVLITDANSSCANPAPLPPVTCSSISSINSSLPPIIDLTCSPISCANPSPSVSESNTSIIDLTCSAISCANPSPSVSQSNTSQSNTSQSNTSQSNTSFSSHPTIRITLIPVNPSSSLPS